MAYRTHTCGELRARDAGKPVVLAGWVARVRDLGGLTFLDLRDRYGKTQVVAAGELPVAQALRGWHSEDVVQIRGTVRLRPEGMVNREMATGEIEVAAEEATLLSPASPLPVGVEEESEVSEELRLKYRYLDLRRPRMLRNLILRHRALQSVRRFHDERGFVEVETPTLICSTPEGARDYLVPSRLHPGSFYALPQSPQLYKQTLMIGGLDRYFQMARCFRDEDLRRDRQPEFTQIDLEMSFVEEEEIFAHTEAMMARLMAEVLDIKVQIPFPRMTYRAAWARFGSDAPDLRYGLEIRRLDEAFAGGGFKAFASILESGGGVFGMRAEGRGHISRKDRDSLEELARAEGLAGLLSVPVEESGVGGLLAKNLEVQRLQKLTAKMEAKPGDLILLAAGEDSPTLAALGRLRRELAQRWNLITPGEYRFCWVVNPPLFEILPGSSAPSAVHHPFTAPMPEDIARLESEPLEVRSRAYDLVLNGIEIATGSIRIHDPALQERVFRIIGLDARQARERFGFLLEALSYGAPPHGGIALGFDRIVMMMAGEASIRDVIAFPKTNTAYSPLDGAPAPVPDEQLAELGLARLKSET